MQIRYNDDSFNIIFVKQTCIFNSKNMKENYSDSAARNSHIDEKRKKYHIFKIKIKISIIFNDLTEQTQMHSRQVRQYIMQLYSSHFEEHSEALS